MSSQNRVWFLQRIIISISSEAVRYIYSSEVDISISSEARKCFQERLRFSLKNMEKERKIHRGGQFLRHEHEDMRGIIEDPIVMEAFRKLGCLRFCEKL